MIRRPLIAALFALGLMSSGAAGEEPQEAVLTQATSNVAVDKDLDDSGKETENTANAEDAQDEDKDADADDTSNQLTDDADGDADADDQDKEDIDGKGDDDEEGEDGEDEDDTDGEDEESSLLQMDAKECAKECDCDAMTEDGQEPVSLLQRDDDAEDEGDRDLDGDDDAEDEGDRDP